MNRSPGPHSAGDTMTLTTTNTFHISNFGAGADAAPTDLDHQNTMRELADDDGFFPSSPTCPFEVAALKAANDFVDAFRA